MRCSAHPGRLEPGHSCEGTALGHLLNEALDPRAPNPRGIASHRESGWWVRAVGRLALPPQVESPNGSRSVESTSEADDSFAGARNLTDATRPNDAKIVRTDIDAVLAP